MTFSEREKRKRSRTEVEHYQRPVQKKITLAELKPVFWYFLKECIQNDFTV